MSWNCGNVEMVGWPCHMQCSTAAQSHAHPAAMPPAEHCAGGHEAMWPWGYRVYSAVNYANHVSHAAMKSKDSWRFGTSCARLWPPLCMKPSARCAECCMPAPRLLHNKNFAHRPQRQALMRPRHPPTGHTATLTHHMHRPSGHASTRPSSVGLLSPSTHDAHEVVSA